jgi:hypothetical protein
VDVQPEDQLAAGRILHLLHDPAVMLTVGDQLVFVMRERMRSRRGEHEPVLLDDCFQVPAQPLKLHRRVADRRADRGLPLDLGLKDLARRTRRELALVVGVEDRVRPLHKIERLGVEQHVLLLDPQRVRLRGAKAVLRNARAGGRSHARPPFTKRITPSLPCRIGDATEGRVVFC